MKLKVAKLKIKESIKVEVKRCNFNFLSVTKETKILSRSFKISMNLAILMTHTILKNLVMKNLVSVMNYLTIRTKNKTKVK